MGSEKLAAAIPLVIALAAGSGFRTGSPGMETRSRPARTPAASIVDEAELTGDQRSWLDDHNPFGVPTTKDPGKWTVVVRRGYTLAHNDVDLIADWVSFHLTKNYVNGHEPRPGSDAFKADPLLIKGHRAELDDYYGWNGVYDRGHQCAAKDSNGRGRSVMRDSFVLSNMTPQSASLNRGKWRILEEQIQQLAGKLGNVWVITGPAFKDDDGDGVIKYFVLGENKVAVPTHYFKIVVARREVGSDKLDAMAFLVPNQATEKDFSEFLVSVDEIEELTGYDFLPKLNNAALEAKVADEVWTTQ